MRVLSWNVGHNDAAWESLEKLRAQEHFDIALLQEAKPPAEAGYARTVIPDSGRRDLWKTELFEHPRGWRTAIAAWEPLDVDPIECAPLHCVAEEDPDRLPESYPGAFTAVRVGDVALVSFYGIWEHLPGPRGSYSIAAVHRAISDLTRLWGSHRSRVVIAGDWNAWHRYGDRDPAARQVHQWSTRNNTVFARLEAEGLQVAGPFGESPLDRCPCGADPECRHVQTYWHQYEEGAKPYQTDYVLATSTVEITGVSVVTHLNGEALWNTGISDHAPLIFDLPTQ
jgi:exonuclease III